MSRTGALETQLSLDRALERDASGEWTKRARSFIEERRYHGELFTSDEMREMIGAPPGTGNIVGALLAQELRAGRIVIVDRQKSARPERHRARINVYAPRHP